MIQVILSDSFGPDAAQGKRKQEFVFLPIHAAGNDVPVDIVQGKSPTLAGIVVQQAQVVFEKIFLQLVIPCGGPYLPTLL